MTDKDKEERLEIFETTIGELSSSENSQKAKKFLNMVIEEERLKRYDC